MNSEPQKDYEKSQEQKSPKKCGLMEPQGLDKGGRVAILDDIQANWSRLPAPPSAAEVNRWIKASRRGE
jgi:hypothetical protein